ncbi:hypothetical protein D4764_12G0005940 [Takifugu flavidus]|uniref:Uncharacterized protein n=1 Tax=Takifugu flavidus TaxID=433684 RepID=A0A5C6PBN3_9TELE|nr:hypothetical protein D4764_12G0005940 [Takifugu flavidus]
MAGLLFPAWAAPCQPPDSSSSPRGPTENTAQIPASEPQSQP